MQSRRQNDDAIFDLSHLQQRSRMARYLTSYAADALCERCKELKSYQDATSGQPACIILWICSQTPWTPRLLLYLCFAPTASAATSLGVGWCVTVSVAGQLLGRSDYAGCKRIDDLCDAKIGQARRSLGGGIPQF